MRIFGHFTDQLPIEVVLQLGLRDAFGRQELGGFVGAVPEGFFHLRDQRGGDVVDDLAARAGRLGVEAELAEEPFDDLDVVLGLGQVLSPLFAQALIGDALEGGLVDLGPGDLRLQRLQEQFVDLSVFHR